MPRPDAFSTYPSAPFVTATPGAETGRGASVRRPSAVAGIRPVPVAGVEVGPADCVPPPSAPFPAGEPASAPPAAGTGAATPLQARATKVASMRGYRIRPPESLQMTDRDPCPGPNHAAVDGGGRRQMLSAGRDFNARRCRVNSSTDKIAFMKWTAGRVASLLAVLGCSHGRAGDACAHGPGILQPLGPGTATIRRVFLIGLENTNWSEFAGHRSAPD